MACECEADRRVEFEAFLEAAIVFARAALHRLQSQHKRHTKWDGWWNELRGNPSIEFFRTERDWLLKEAPPKIGQRLIAGTFVNGGHSLPPYVPSKAAVFYFFEPNADAIDTVERHLQELDRVLQDAEDTFK
jgi:hypothetical protein